MKFLKTMLVLVMSFIVMSAKSQTVSANAYFSTSSVHQMGVDVFGTVKGFVFGLGGSHSVAGNVYTDVNFGSNHTGSYLPIGGTEGNHLWDNTPLAQRDLLKRYTLERGSLTGLLGYSFKGKTTVIADLGVSFRQDVWEGNTGGKATPVTSNTNSSSGYFYDSRTMSPGFLYGGSVVQKLGGNLGVVVGYNNIQEFKLGLNYTFQ